MAEKAELILTAADRTAAAFKSAQRNLTSLQASVTGLVGKLGAIGAGVGALGLAFDRINPMKVIDAADNLGKLSQRSGVAVESLSALNYAAKLSDVSTDELAASLKRLNQNIAAAARGEKEQAAAFKAIGVSVTDAAGKVRSADAVFEDIAEKFAGYEDGANKVALANALGGKSFEALIPLLNGGRDGLKEAREELEKFGGIISGDLAAKSEKFNDNMTRLGVASESLAISLTTNLIDALVKYSAEAVKATKEGNLLWFSLKKLGEVFSGKVTREIWFGPDSEAGLRDAQKTVDEFTARVTKMQQELAKDPGNTGLQARLARLKGHAADAQAALDKLKPPPAAAKQETKPDKPKPDAPKLPTSSSTAASDAEALLRKTLDGRVKAIQAGLENERDLFQHNAARLDEMYHAGEVSITQFFDQKAQAQTDFLAKQQQGFDAEIAALRDAQARMSKPQDRQDIENKVNEVLERQAKAYREAGQAAEVAETQRQRAAAEFSSNLRSMDAQIAELSGDRFGAELLRNAEELDKARKVLAAGGGDPAREQALASALRMQAEFNKSRADAARISEQAQVAEEAFLIQAERAGLSQVQTEEGVMRIRERSLTQMDELITRTEELIATNKGLADPELLAYLEQLRLARERAFDAKDPAVLRYKELANEAGQTIAQGFEDAVLSGKKFSDVIAQIGRQLAQMIMREGVTKLIGQTIGSYFGNLGASAGGSSGTVGANAAIADQNSLYGYRHGGGIVGGNGGTLRWAPTVDMASLPRYHGGGVAGLQRDEMHAVLRKGEEVLTQSDPRHRNNGGAASPVQVINNLGVQAQPTVEQRPDGMMRIVLNSVAEDTRRGGVTARATAGRFGVNNGATLNRRRG